MGTVLERYCLRYCRATACLLRSGASTVHSPCIAHMADGGCMCMFCRAPSAHVANRRARTSLISLAAVNPSSCRLKSNPKLYICCCFCWYRYMALEYGENTTRWNRLSFAKHKMLILALTSTRMVLVSVLIHEVSSYLKYRARFLDMRTCILRRDVGIVRLSHVLN